MGTLERQRLTDHPAHRQADPVRVTDSEGGQELGRVVGQQVERVGAGRSLGASVPAGVVGKHAIACAQGRELRLPHRQVGGQGVAQRDHGRVRGPLEGVVHLDAVRLDLHRFASCRFSSVVQRRTMSQKYSCTARSPMTSGWKVATSTVP